MKISHLGNFSETHCLTFRLCLFLQHFSPAEKTTATDKDTDSAVNEKDANASAKDKGVKKNSEKCPKPAKKGEKCSRNVQRVYSFEASVSIVCRTLWQGNVAFLFLFTGKLAPIFAKKDDEPVIVVSEESTKPKVPVDPEKLRAQRDFLMSGAPEQLKKARALASACSAEYPPFPAVGQDHVRQESVSLSGKAQKMPTTTLHKLKQKRKQQNKQNQKEEENDRRLGQKGKEEGVTHSRSVFTLLVAKSKETCWQAPLKQSC